MHLDILHFSLINTLPGDKKFQAAGGKVKVVAQALKVRENFWNQLQYIDFQMKWLTKTCFSRVMENLFSHLHQMSISSLGQGKVVANLCLPTFKPGQIAPYSVNIIYLLGRSIVIVAIALYLATLVIIWQWQGQIHAQRKITGVLQRFNILYLYLAPTGAVVFILV